MGIGEGDTSTGLTVEQMLREKAQQGLGKIVKECELTLRKVKDEHNETPTRYFVKLNSYSDGTSDLIPKGVRIDFSGMNIEISETMYKLLLSQWNGNKAYGKVTLELI